MRICSITLAPDGRKTGYSLPLGMIIRGSVPVVFAHVRMPPSRNPAAINRVTDDLPRVPLMWIRSGSFSKLRRCTIASASPKAINPTVMIASSKTPFMPGD
jgi:hypothetical protein